MDVKLIQYTYNDNGKKIIVDETKAPFDGEKYLLINHNGDGCIGYWVKLEYKPSNYFDDDYDGFCWCNDDGECFELDDFLYYAKIPSIEEIRNEYKGHERVSIIYK